MDTARIRLAHARDETPPNTYSDFEWAKEHEKELFAQYGSTIALVYEKKVVGIGATLDEAAQNAEANLPPESGQITPVIILVHQRHPFLRVYPTPVQREK